MASSMADVVLLILASSLLPHAVSAARLSDYVDPLIGTVGSNPLSAIAGGNSFPGASLPWSMAKPGIDTSFLGVPNGTAVDCNAGYTPLGNVTAISMTHVSGTGGTPTYGLISQMPILGDLTNVNLGDNTTYWQNRTVGSEKASTGLFSTTLFNGIGIEITSTKHAGFMRYRTSPPVSSNASSQGVPAGPLEPATSNGDLHVLVDLTHVLPGYGNQNYSQKFLTGDLKVDSSSDGQPSYYGSATYTGGWSQPESQTLYFCANFTIPASSNLEPTSSYVVQNTDHGVAGAGTFSWPYDAVVPPPFYSRPVPRSFPAVHTYAGSGMGIGALFSWTPSGNNATAESVVESRVGISYISASQACQSVANELPLSKTFEDVVEQARKAWEDEILTKIEVVDDGSETSQNSTLKRMLYTALYQTGLMPTDKTAENPYWNTDDNNPYYDDFYTLWDIYRSLMPLYHLLYTETYSRLLKGLISIYTHEGFLPAGRIANWNGRVQGGTHADMVLVDAYVKRSGGELAADIDWQQAYRALLNDADNLPIRNVDSATFDGATKEGRGALDDYLRLGFITRNHTRSISRGVEYSQNDFAIYSMAKSFPNASSDDVERFLKRASYWENQWNAEANTSLLVPSISATANTTFMGFPAARNSDGSWNYTDYDPLSCGGCSWANDIYEAKVWETGFGTAPHDMAKIIELMGGDDAFVQRLDVTFLPGYGTSVGANNDAGTAIFNPGNEPSFATPFLYNYVPKHHWKTANQTRATVDAFYSDSRGGYPGNIDGGALPSWLVFNLIGLYPMSPQPIYLLGAPRFSSLRIKLFSGTAAEKVLSIKAPGLSATSYYPQSVSFNGQQLDRSWLTHEELGQGGSLIFEMGSEPAEWDVGQRPPSLSPW